VTDGPIPTIGFDLVAGFGVRFTPTVTAFIVQWRDSRGSKPRETLKRWPACSVEDARNLARKRLSEVLGNRESGSDVQTRLAMRSWYEQASLITACCSCTFAGSPVAIVSESEERARLTADRVSMAWRGKPLRQRQHERLDSRPRRLDLPEQLAAAADRE
jgi:hypothetical protein